MYGYKIPRHEISITIFDQQIKTFTQSYHIYESSFLKDYKKMYGEYPVLSVNCDSDYK